MKKVIKMSYFKTYNKMVNESVLEKIGQGIQTMNRRSLYYKPQREKEYRQRELDRKIERENRPHYGLDEIYNDNPDNKDYPDLSKQYVHV